MCKNIYIYICTRGVMVQITHILVCIAGIKSPASIGFGMCYAQRKKKGYCQTSINNQTTISSTNKYKANKQIK